MKTYKHLFTLAMAGLLAVSCQEDTAINTTLRPAEVGDPILFGASAAYENANPGQTRTEYSGDVVDGKETIWWVPGTDKVQIYCAEASVPGFTGDEAHISHYVVMGDKSNGAGKENWLQKLSENSLAWGTQDEHVFYGMYPSSLMFVNADNSTSIGADYMENITMKGTVMSGYIHTEQVPASVTNTASSDDPAKYVAKPDMHYAYMIAKTTTTRQKAYEVGPNGVNGVSMNFIPLATALEVTLSLPTRDDAQVDVNPVPIAQVSVQGNGVAGQFSTDLQNWNGQTLEGLKVNSGNYSNTITIPVDASTGTDGAAMGLLLKPGESFTFTVFLHPNADIDALKIGFSSDKQGANTIYKSIAEVGIVALKKNKGINLRLPVKFEHKPLDLSAWMAQIEDKNISVSRLSLPGTGNSFSYGTTITTNTKYYQAQTLTFEQQWNAGIRAFEIVTDRYNSNTLNSSNTLSNLVLQCGKEDVIDATIGNSTSAPEITVTEAVDAILAKLAAYPSETALAVFTYQPEGNSPNRRGYAYMYAFMNFINQSKYSNKLVLFSPTLTLAQAQGKLMIVVRPNSKDEGDYYLNGNSYSKDDAGQNAGIWTAIQNRITGTNSQYVVAVNGCGTGKDKWGARGFKINDGNETRPARDISNWNGAMNSPSNQWWIEQYMYNGGYVTDEYRYTGGEEQTVRNQARQTATITRAPLNPLNPTEVLNFGYQTNKDYQCWYQEWSRVLSADIKQGAGSWRDPTSGSSYNYHAIDWFESYDEKLSNAKTTFDMATSGLYDGTHDGYGAYVFINSLCGYLAKDNDPEESVIPSVNAAYGGGYGDIVALADKINKDFYNYANSKIATAQSSTGIIFMDRVSNMPTKSDGTLDPSYWLPQLILGNNKAYFKDDVIVPGGGGEGTGGSGNGDGDGDSDWG